ncbi:hypothetical protein ACTD5D_21175 [Nocardia takedensis]|uniref:hypothetical protein n=1 Tax=Nocardia takedensis TaxID=259390 RepID=UPI003F75B63B
MSEIFHIGSTDPVELDIVFIHGLDGDARGSWSGTDVSSFWPQWLLEEIDGVAVWTVDYEAWSTGWRGRAMPLQDRAVNLLAQLQNHGLGQRPLCFVTHSMGGLLVKELLLLAAERRTEFTEFADNTGGVAFLGTPHNGAALAGVVQALGMVYRGSNAVKDLRRNSAHLRQLSDRYRDWVAETGIRHLVMFETYKTYGTQVVDAGSANPGLAGVRAIGVDANHIDICKPEHRNELVYLRVKRLITELLGQRRDTDATGPPPLSLLIAQSADQRKSLAPVVIPDVDRTAQFETRVRGPLARLRFPLVLIGEGGLGKSVLLGQVYDMLTTEPGVTTTVLVTCARVPATAELDTAEAIDRALGIAATGGRWSVGLTEVLDNLPDNAPRYVLIDTVDLIVREANSDAIAHTLRELSARCRLIWTCRDHEWDNYLRSVHGIGETHYPMPPLTREDIGHWARAYTGRREIAAEIGERFIDSLVGANSSAGVLEVCATPLRLSMACEVYAESGAIPEHLTVTELYDGYWDKRIAHDRYGHGPLSSSARRQTATADFLAAQMWAQSRSRLAVSVPGDGIDDVGALELLLSDGVVRLFADRYGFFHQTFVEYAVARRLRRAGDDEDLARLRSGLERSAVPTFWPVARHLAVLEMDDPRYERVCEAIPLTEVEGVKIQLLGAFRRRAPHHVENIAATVVSTSPTHLDTNATVLAQATPECQQAAMAVLIGRIGSAPPKILSRLFTAAAELLERLSDDRQRARAVGSVLDALTGREPALSKELLASVSTRFSAAVLAQRDGHDPAVESLVARYRELPASTRREIVTAIARAEPDPARDTDLLMVAITVPCPERAVEEMTAILIRTWPVPRFRERIEWDGWRAVLDNVLEERWVACQVRLVAHLCRDLAVAEAVFDVATTGTVTDEVSDRYVNVAKYIADSHRDMVMARIRGLGPRLSTTAVGVVCEVVTHIADSFDRTERDDITAALTQWLDIVERTVWPAMIKTAGTEADLLAARAHALLDYHRRGGNPSVVGSSFDTFINTQTAQPATLVPLAEYLYPLVRGENTDSWARRAVLDGLLCAYSTEARQRATVCVHGQRTKSAAAAAKGIAAALEGWPTPRIDDATVAWLFELLETTHANVVQVITGKLCELHTRMTLPISRAENIAQRLSRSPARNEDPQTAAVLLRLLTIIDRDHDTRPPSEGDEFGGRLDDKLVQRVIAKLSNAFRDLLPDTVAPRRRRNLPALFNVYKQSLTALGIAHLDQSEIEDHAVEILINIDIDTIAGRTQRPLAHLLIKLARRRPHFLNRLEQLWPQVSDAGKNTIAECFTTIEAGTTGHRSLALARRPDCPVDTAGEIYSIFNS